MQWLLYFVFYIFLQRGGRVFRFFLIIFPFALPLFVLGHETSNEHFHNAGSTEDSTSFGINDQVEVSGKTFYRNGVDTPPGIYTITDIKNGQIQINGQYVAPHNMPFVSFYEASTDEEDDSNESQPIEPYNPWGQINYGTITTTTMYKVAEANDPFGGKMFVIFKCTGRLTYSFNLLNYPDVHSTRIRATSAEPISVYQPSGKIYNEAGNYFEIRDQGLVQAPRFFQDLDTFTVRGKTNSFTVDTNYYWTIYKSWMGKEDRHTTGIVSFTFSVPDFG